MTAGLAALLCPAPLFPARLCAAPPSAAKPPRCAVTAPGWERRGAGAPPDCSVAGVGMLAAGELSLPRAVADSERQIRPCPTGLTRSGREAERWVRELRSA